MKYRKDFIPYGNFLLTTVEIGDIILVHYSLEDMLWTTLVIEKKLRENIRKKQP